MGFGDFVKKTVVKGKAIASDINTALAEQDEKRVAKKREELERLRATNKKLSEESKIDKELAKERAKRNKHKNNNGGLFNF